MRYSARMQSRISDTPVRRAFVDTQAGQIHIRRAGAERAGRVPLLLLHQSPSSSLTYAEVLPFLGAERLAIAVDTPGFGESFRPDCAPTIADYARWIAAVPAELGFDRFDVMGLFTGAGIAAEIARMFPHRVRCVVLAGPPVFTSEQQAGFVANAWPSAPQPDGSHFAVEWQRVMARPMAGMSFERRCDSFNEFYRGGANAIWGEQAIAVYPMAETLPQLSQPTLILEPNGINGDCRRAAALIPNGRLERIDHLGYSMMQVIPETVAARVQAFLDEKNAA